METSPLPEKGCKTVGPYWALVAPEQGEIFVVLYLLWHGTSVFAVSPDGPLHFCRLIRKARSSKIYSKRGIWVKEKQRHIGNYFSIKAVVLLIKSFVSSLEMSHISFILDHEKCLFYFTCLPCSSKCHWSEGLGPEPSSHMINSCQYSHIAPFLCTTNID